MYEYRATILDVIDGDTVHAEVQLGCDVSTRLTIRLAGINAPEMRASGKPNKAGVDAMEHLIQLLLPSGVTEWTPPTITLFTVKDHREKYGRYLGYIRTDQGIRVNDRMVADGYAVPYDGKGPRSN